MNLHAFAPPFDHLVYVRAVEACNIHCEHCFAPKGHRRMTLGQIASITSYAKTFAAPGDTILLQWHGGEPTLMGAAGLRRAIEAVHANGSGYTWRHGIQTNLTTYGRDWRALYIEHFGGEVGVSWDPEIRLTHKGDSASNAGFECIFRDRLARLLDDGLSPYLVVTVTKKFASRFADPFRFFALLTEMGIRRAHLERITPTGEALANWSRLGLDNAAYARLMARYLRAYVAWNERTVFISPFDGILESVARLGTDKATGYGCWSGRCDSRFHTLDTDGFRPGCAALMGVVSDPAKARTAHRERCGTCRFRPVCSSGCLTVGWDGSGECPGGSAIFEAAAAIAANTRRMTA